MSFQKFDENTAEDSVDESILKSEAFLPGVVDRLLSRRKTVKELIKVFCYFSLIFAIFSIFDCFSNGFLLYFLLILGFLLFKIFNSINKKLQPISEKFQYFPKFSNS